MKKRYLLALLGSMSATTMASELSYSTFEFAHFRGEAGEQNLDYGGLGIRASIEVSSNIFIGATALSIEYDDKYYRNGREDQISVASLTALAGFHLPITEKIDFVTTVEYETAQAELFDAEEDANGYAIGLGLRGKVNKVEWSGVVNHVDFEGDTSFSYGAGARYFFTPRLSFGVLVAASDDSNSVASSGRLDF